MFVLSSGVPSEFKDHFYQPEFSKQLEGELLVMPSGYRDGSYASKLNSIDWHELYDQREGFLLLEDLKEQWKTELNPDYVLIDSRTGHTEVGGICTRQLPDTVVVMFIPNEQNLAGVSTVVDAIREEDSNSRVKINVELVASNVPSLDDEHEILRRMMRKFENRLASRDTKVSPRRQITTINRYDSLHLLDQSVFVTDRPKSRLARQYRTLLSKVVAYNLDDRDAAMQALTKSFPKPSRRSKFIASDFHPFVNPEEQGKIAEILNRHPEDAEIAFIAGQLFRGRGDLDEAELFFARAVKHSQQLDDEIAAKYQLELIETKLNLGKRDGVEGELVELLAKVRSTNDLQQVISLLMKVCESPSDQETLEHLTFEQLVNIAPQVSLSRNWQQFVGRKLTEFSTDQLTEAIKKDFGVVLVLIGSGKHEALILALEESGHLESSEIAYHFNYAMAKWARDKTPDKDAFRKVLELDSAEPLRNDANYEQCLALSAFVEGDITCAKDRLEHSSELAGNFALHTFSCWQYLDVDRTAFLADLAELGRLIDGEELLPAFMR